MFPIPPLCRLRRIGAALMYLVLAGCGGMAGEGQLRTWDGKPLRLADDAVLRQGPVRLKFDPDPWLWGRLRLYNADSGFSVRVPASAYAGHSFTLDGEDSGLAYDIRARWREVRGETLDRDGTASCTTAGYCSKTVRRLDCGRKRYQEGTRGYRRHEDDEGCEEESAVEWGYFPDCPGSRAVRERYQVYKLLVSLDFRVPFAARPPVAEFDGETRYRERLVETLERGDCQAH